MRLLHNIYVIYLKNLKKKLKKSNLHWNYYVIFNLNFLLIKINRKFKRLKWYKYDQEKKYSFFFFNERINKIDFILLNTKINNEYSFDLNVF